jgi:hypothetical protein
MNNNLKEIKTTIIGSILFLIGAGMATKGYFLDQVYAWGDYAVPAAVMVAGIGFLLAPDKVLNLILRKANKKIQ